MPYDKPKRLRVLIALTNALKQISIANGYKTDLNGAVFRGRTQFGDDDPLPLLSILETPVPVELINGPGDWTGAFGEWDLLIQGFVQDDPLNPTDPAHVLMADVKSVLAKEVRKNADFNILDLGKSGVTELTIGPGTVRPADDISSVAYFWLRITLKIAEDNLDPYV